MRVGAGAEDEGQKRGERFMGNTVGIVGGGAAGMMAAVTAARRGGKVTLLEGNDRLGKKILSTGNGKCNLGNEKLGASDYHTGRPDMLEEFLGQFGTADTVSFFRGIGLMTKSRGGYLYPVCEQAAAVLDVLRHEVRAAGVEVVTDFKAGAIERSRRAGLFRVHGNGGSCCRRSFERVILACGGRAAPKTGSDGSGYLLAGQLGHSLVPTVPALVQLRCREEYLKAVAGVRAEAQISVYCQGKRAAEERGELQLTEYGISGIPVFQLSRTVNYILAEGQIPEIVVDFLPDYTQEEFKALYQDRKLLREQRTVEEFFTGMLHKKLMLLFIKLAGLKPGEPAGQADERKLNRVFELCRRWTLHAIGSNSYDSAQVCAGGVPLEEVTGGLESRLVPGLYFAGEILDVDGRCGGYNLQWAWCSGFIAGCHAAGRD